MNFIKKRIDAGDFESSSSVLGSKFYLAGLDETNQQTLLQYYRKQRFTQEMAAQEGLDKVGKAALHKIAILEKFRKSLSSKQTLRDMAGQDAVEQALRS